MSKKRLDCPLSRAGKIDRAGRVLDLADPRARLVKNRQML
jgi:hypothetical protein